MCDTLAEVRSAVNEHQKLENIGGMYSNWIASVLSFYLALGLFSR
jgi:hypothetical protein